MGQEQSSDRKPLSAFCCNSNLCNNDSNIDNRITEVNRKNQHRTMLAAEHKSRGDSFNTNATNGAGPYTQNYRNSKQDEYGNLKNTE